MANLTLSIDDRLLADARAAAQRAGTTVTQLVREHLANIAQRDVRTARARARLAELAARSTAQLGPRSWTRAELYQRGRMGG